MTTIAILPNSPGAQGTHYRVIAGQKQSVGRTAGLEALVAAELRAAADRAAAMVRGLSP